MQDELRAAVERVRNCVECLGDDEQAIIDGPTDEDLRLLLSAAELTLSAEWRATWEAIAAIAKAKPGPFLAPMTGNIVIDFNGAYEDSKAAHDALQLALSRKLAEKGE